LGERRERTFRDFCLLLLQAAGCWFFRGSQADTDCSSGGRLISTRPPVSWRLVFSIRLCRRSGLHRGIGPLPTRVNADRTGDCHVEKTKGNEPRTQPFFCEFLGDRGRASGRREKALAPSTNVRPRGTLKTVPWPSRPRSASLAALLRDRDCSGLFETDFGLAGRRRTDRC